MQSEGCRVPGSGFRVQGSGFRVQGVGCKVQGSGYRVQGAGCRVRVDRLRVARQHRLERGRVARDSPHARLPHILESQLPTQS